MYKMICLDLDGTVLNDCKEISQENINLIRRACKEKGIICVFATGRPLEYVDEICNSYDSLYRYATNNERSKKHQGIKRFSNNSQ